MISLSSSTWSSFMKGWSVTMSGTQNVMTFQRPRQSPHSIIDCVPAECGELHFKSHKMSFFLITWFLKKTINYRSVTIIILTIPIRKETKKLFSGNGKYCSDQSFIGRILLLFKWMMRVRIRWNIFDSLASLKIFELLFKQRNNYAEIFNYCLN